MKHFIIINKIIIYIYSKYKIFSWLCGFNAKYTICREIEIDKKKLLGVSFNKYKFID